MERGMVFRIAFRNEGEHVNCYYAAPDTMEGAMLLSSMRRSLLRSVPGMWDQWREMMRAALALATEEVLGVTADDWETHPAPEHERAGNG